MKTFLLATLTSSVALTAQVFDLKRDWPSVVPESALDVPMRDTAILTFPPGYVDTLLKRARSGLTHLGQGQVPISEIFNITNHLKIHGAFYE